MYSHCLFCHSDLGRNTLIEAFPVGRRLAYDASRGRLWVVCRKCERWNLTPLEERWQAIEDAERLYRGTRVRVATEQVGLARFRDEDGPVELVRIGKPLRPEFAAWRYGDQFGRRRRRHLLYSGAAAAAGGALVIAGPVMGLVSFGAISPAINLFNVANSVYWARKLVRLPMDDGPALLLRRDHMGSARLMLEDGEWHLSMKAMREGDSTLPWWKPDRRGTPVTLRGAAAMRAAGAMLPAFNASGGSPARVQEAVRLIEQHASPEEVYRAVAAEAWRRWRNDSWQIHDAGGFKQIPVAMRLALEMVSHEDTERRAMEGELALLEAAWKDAEEIASIADQLGTR
ncbi:MAG TPA: hypothetical protein VEA99_10930 [Gemmatimonadaceae bacterium]|nr:hypothetical protein [Gemmatimonadaceae bacterium]